jgi:hypothetical protein
MFTMLYVLTLVALFGIGVFLGFKLAPKYYREWKTSKEERHLGSFFSCLFGSIFLLAGGVIILAKKLFMYIACSVLIVFSTTGFANSIAYSVRESYAKKIEGSFVLQSIGRTREAFYQFKAGYQEAIAAGEAKKKLKVLDELFKWYRRYGYSAGVLFQPSDCTDEYRPDLIRNAHFNYTEISTHEGYPYQYRSEWEKRTLEIQRLEKKIEQVTGD